MAKFYNDEVDRNWYLEMFEKYTGQQISRTEIWGYRDQVMRIFLKDPEANERFSIRYHASSNLFYQLELDLDMGTLNHCKLPEAKEWSVAGMYRSEHPGVDVLEVRPKAYSSSWIITCRKETDND